MKKTLEKRELNVPCAYITKSKQRVKQFNDTVYLKDKEEFELELFNPLITKILAKIELNGISIGSGIILRPGERVYLERYLDKAKKFLFETYSVDGDNKQVLNAITYNGSVSVKFYLEQIQYPKALVQSPQNGTYTTFPNTLTGGYVPVVGTNTNPFTFTGNLNDTLRSVNVNTTGTFNSDGIGLNSFYNSTTGTNNTLVGSTSFATYTSTSPVMDSLGTPNTIETGRIEEGSNSNQTFTYDSTSFYTWHSYATNWKILPQSQKPVVKEDLVVYCVNCGTKRRKDTHKFCPNCGTKY